MLLTDAEEVQLAVNERLDDHSRSLMTDLLEAYDLVAALVEVHERNLILFELNHVILRFCSQEILPGLKATKIVIDVRADVQVDQGRSEAKQDEALLVVYHFIWRTLDDLPREKLRDALSLTRRLSILIIWMHLDDIVVSNRVLAVIANIASGRGIYFLITLVHSRVLHQGEVYLGDFLLL